MRKNERIFSFWNFMKFIQGRCLAGRGHTSDSYCPFNYKSLSLVLAGRSEMFGQYR